jgi:hypothetical protein
MTTNHIKKGMKVRCVQLGTPVTAIMMDNRKGNTRMLDVRGSEVGLFDEIGSVYAHDIIEVEIDGEWRKITHTERQMYVKDMNNALFGE